jgi:branched-chain amino acid transport system ATP-binding protein
MSKTILSVEDLGISFGSNHVLKSVSFEVREQEVLGVIGPNGAGKTVMLNILSGILSPTRGRIVFLGREISKMKITERTRMGLGRTFQVPRPFGNMTVYENILTGGVYGRKIAEEEAAAQAKEILALIRFPPGGTIWRGSSLFWTGSGWKSGSPSHPLPNCSYWTRLPAG